MTPSAQSGLLFSCLLSIAFSAQSQVYFEDFSGEANGATSGTAVGGTWTTTTPSGGAGSFSRLNVGAPYGGILSINNTGTEGVWTSNSIDISTFGEVALEVLMGGNNATAADYVRAYYILDGGAETLFAQVVGNGALTVFAASSAVVTGSTLQIVIRGMDNSGGGGLMGFDDVTVTDISVLYSIANTAWNNGSTWSTTGFAGVACGCTPDADSRVIIGNGHTVNFTAAGTAAGVEIQNTGTLQWTANNLGLTIARGGVLDVQNGGVLTRVATTGSSVIFANYSYAATVAGTVNIGRLTFTSSGGSTIVNSGTLTLATAVGLVLNGGTGYTITNSGTFNLTDMDLNTADLTINNSGTINQTGNFTDVDAGSTFNNLSNGTWNFGGTTITGVRLFANNNSNTFNYNRAGAQNIITPQDAYSNLSLSGSGAKTAQASFAVRGDWTRSGATYTNGGFTVSLTGSIAQSISATGGETFANLIINNSFGTSPHIMLNNAVTVSNVLTMTAGNVNLNGNTLTLSSAAAGALSHSMASTAGWAYGGNFTRAYPTTAITVGTVAGFYPLGGSAEFRPFFIGKNSVAASNGTITISHTDATTVTDITFTDGAATIQRRHDSFWTLSKTGVTAGTFNISAGGTGYSIGAVNEIRLTRSADATGIGTAGASTGTPANVRAHRTGLTAAQLVNNYYVASTNSASSPLPIELAYFHARLEGAEVVLTWKTLQEDNNQDFTIQKTTDFETFYLVGSLAGQGNTKEEHNYRFVDDSPFRGKSYYRLKQTDYDLKFTFSDLVMIDNDESSSSLNAYPNPFDGNEITFEVKGLSDVQQIPVAIYNNQGQKVMEVTICKDDVGRLKQRIVFPSGLPQGMYLMKAGKTVLLTRKVTVN